MEGFSYVTLVVDKIFRLGQKHWNGMKMLYKNRAKQKIILLPPVAIIIAIPIQRIFYLVPTSTWRPTLILRLIFSINPFISSQDYVLSNEISIIIS